MYMLGRSDNNETGKQLIEKASGHKKVVVV